MKRTKKTEIEHLENRPVNWFPGHMKKAVENLKTQIKLVDIILEIRDARAPLASGNKANYDNNSTKPYLIVLNKSNLTTPKAIEDWEYWFQEKNENFVFINAQDQDSVKTIITKSKEIIQKHNFNTNAKTKNKEHLKMMILGLPNTGKSTIINVLASRQATKAAATPGHTKVQLWVKAQKNLDILDTPGVMPPKIHKQNQALWLSAIHALPDHIITPDQSACFIIEHLIKNKSEEFRKFYHFESLELDIASASQHIASQRGCLRSGGEFNYEKTYKIIISDFRKGNLGNTIFELPPSK